MSRTQSRWQQVQAVRLETPDYPASVKCFPPAGHCGRTRLEIWHSKGIPCKAELTCKFAGSCFPIVPHIFANNSVNFCDKTNQFFMSLNVVYFCSTTTHGCSLVLGKQAKKIQFFMSLNAVYFCSITTHGCSLVLGKQAKKFTRNYCSTVKSNIFLKMHFKVFRSTSNVII